MTTFQDKLRKNSSTGVPVKKVKWNGIETPRAIKNVSPLVFADIPGLTSPTNNLKYTRRGTESVKNLLTGSMSFTRRTEVNKTPHSPP